MLKPWGKEGPTEKTPESKFHPFYFKAYVKKCVSKLSNENVILKIQEMNF